MSAQPNSKVWPEHPSLLIPGVNDTWNAFQREWRGKAVTSEEWKAAREELHAGFKAHLANGGEQLKNKDDMFR
jgi:hypothetical protein